MSLCCRCAEEGLDPVNGLRLLNAERLSLYIELNVAFKLTAEDDGLLPHAEAKVWQGISNHANH